MAFITLVLKNTLPEQWHPWRGLRVLAVLFCLAPAAQASDFLISDINTEIKDGVYLLDADIDYRFTEETLQALSNGVPLTVNLIIEIERIRNWWLNVEVAKLEQRFSLQYHALSHQYTLHNLNSGAFYSYPHYFAAIEAMGTLRDLPLLDSKLITPQEEYEGAIRVELDIEALPSPLRPVAYLTPAWRLQSDWYKWSLTP